MSQPTPREALEAYALETFDARRVHPWRHHVDHVALVHTDNDRLFALTATVEARSLGLTEDGRLDIVTLKVGDRFLAEALSARDGYFPGFPMRRGGWVSISLEGDVAFEEVCSWLAESYLATASRAERERMRPPKEWIIPANPRYFDIIGAFEASDEIEWKQGRGIRVRDTVFMYVAAPHSAILYGCEVTATNIPYHLDDGNVRIRELMRIRLQRRYAPDAFTLDVLSAGYGVTTVRGPRGVPASLSEALSRGEG